MKNIIFKGVCTALVTPFKNGEVDYLALNLLLQRQIDSGVSAIVVLGTTGEPCCLTEEEKEKIIKTTINYCHGKIKVLVGCGSNCTKSAIKSYKMAEALGADGALIVTPYYNKCTQNGIVQYYKEIASAGKLPIIAYNVPSRTGINIDVGTAIKLAEIDNICGIKEASGNITQILKYFYAIGNKIAIYSGDDAMNYIFMALGGMGTISVLSNLLPCEATQMVDLCLNKKYEKALLAQCRLSPIIDALFLEVNPIPIKMALEYIGLCTAEVRPPLTKMTQENQIKLKQEINNCWNNCHDSM